MSQHVLIALGMPPDLEKCKAPARRERTAANIAGPSGPRGRAHSR